MNKKTIYNLIVCEDKVKELSKVNSKLEFDKHLIISSTILDVSSSLLYFYNLFNLNIDGMFTSMLGNCTARCMQTIGMIDYSENTFKKLILTNIKKD